MLSDYSCFVIFFGAYVVAVVLLRQRSHRRLREWGTAQGYDVVRTADVWLWGPLPFPLLKRSNGWTIKRLVVRTETGGERTALVCYPAGFPLFETSKLEQVELVWEDEWRGGAKGGKTPAART